MNIEILKKYAPGYENLDEVERISVHHFSLLWTIFEAQVLDTNASANKISSKVKEWNDQGLLNERWFDDVLEYFRNRYMDTQAEGFNDKFASLHFRRHDNEELVKAVLSKEKESIPDQLTACMIIVLRFRNNFFHGLKWAYKMRDQQGNFEHSIKLMQECIDRFATAN
ncbi:hypothetical protein [Kiloniella antarctica]|uniref:Uncharacterized protein n=1 Tax=Kiloniella antarctica TaxID=1550907 RepID=A0ABW5BKJ1_9PROT